MAPHRKSKRESLKHKYKVQRKVAEHHRRVRRLLRKQRQQGAVQGRQKLHRDLGVPNLYPYKQQLLEQAARRLALRSTVGASAEPTTLRTNLGPSSLDASGRPLGSSLSPVVRSRQAFAAELRRVVELSDVVLEVLDARNPLESRSLALERLVLMTGARTAGGKRLVLVLSKADLVPHEALKAWLCRLRAEYPTLATHEGLDEAGRRQGPRQRGSAAQASQLAQLVRLLKLYARKRAEKQSGMSTITVGIVGKPNVGKSSLLNALRRGDDVVATGPRPGVTKALQEVRLDRHIRLLDSPGVVLDLEGDADAPRAATGSKHMALLNDTSAGPEETLLQEEARMALAGYLGVDELSNAMHAARMVLERSQFNADGALSLLYEMPAFSLTDMVEWNDDAREDSFVTQFLALLAKRRGLVRKAGMLDLDAAARLLVQDWVSGRIPYYTTPRRIGLPSTHQSDAQIVTSMSKGFDLDSLEPPNLQSAGMTLADIERAPDSHTMPETDDQVTYHLLKQMPRVGTHRRTLPVSAPPTQVDPMEEDKDDELGDYEFTPDGEDQRLE
jgi:nuclear GTP-binding protein